MIIDYDPERGPFVVRLDEGEGGVSLDGLAGWGVYSGIQRRVSKARFAVFGKYVVIQNYILAPFVMDWDTGNVVATLQTEIWGMPYIRNDILYFSLASSGMYAIMRISLKTDAQIGSLCGEGVIRDMFGNVARIDNNDDITGLMDLDTGEYLGGVGTLKPVYCTIAFEHTVLDFNNSDIIDLQKQVKTSVRDFTVDCEAVYAMNHRHVFCAHGGTIVRRSFWNRQGIVLLLDPSMYLRSIRTCRDGRHVLVTMYQPTPPAGLAS
jgi:hypothetical protein